MALKATIFKAQIGIADMDRPYYGDHAVTLARHPSETDERMLVRLIAFALHVDDALGFGKGLSTDDEPDLWRRDLTGAIELWIDVGLPDEKRVRKACGRAAAVFVYSYGGRGADLWWTQNAGTFERLRNLTVINLRYGPAPSLASLATRNMDLRFTVQEQQIWITDGVVTVEVETAMLTTSARSLR
jgi:uncharacterized protein YaeQ